MTVMIVMIVMTVMIVMSEMSVGRHVCSSKWVHCGLVKRVWCPRMGGGRLGMHLLRMFQGQRLEEMTVFPRTRKIPSGW